MFKQGGRCATYLYDQNQKKKNTWGIGHTTKCPVFTKDRWHHVALQIKLNDPGGTNGYACILIDDQEVVKTENVKFREKGGDDTRIQKLLFSTFHGGNTNEWAPVDKNGQFTTVYACFDNFRVTAWN